MPQFHHRIFDRQQKPGLTHEIIVVDNNSTDLTAELAKQAGAKVVFESINQIGRARDTGATAATGDWLLFVDADSLLNPGMIAEISMNYCTRSIAKKSSQHFNH